VKADNKSLWNFSSPAICIGSFQALDQPVFLILELARQSRNDSLPDNGALFFCYRGRHNQLNRGEHLYFNSPLPATTGHLLFSFSHSFHLESSHIYLPQKCSISFSFFSPEQSSSAYQKCHTKNCPFGISTCPSLRELQNVLTSS
jgi:hypothetical protein